MAASAVATPSAKPPRGAPSEDEMFRPDEPVPLGTDYAAVIESDVPVVVQHTRLDSRQAANTIMTTIAFPA